ncbi:helix-turn-helix transcriptional regulator [Ramlibacter sp. USB13]|uniref:Helix-turn-helix transcriptional regulator n=1 Tax=Ramlibacter cellulosilyticus TaxID=2764187 RepID=A0A923MP60_9BURK|nr:helix-turn-helix transcriptional regulator [Ramlibacter cellulosilyticus]MBC5782266.1 helix-turn-helix transcriptional regulator [Ramlibacter cellulosilyticus]
MDLSERSFLQCLDVVYAAAEDSARWREVFEHLRDVLGVKSIHMLGVDKRHGALSYSDGVNLPVEGELAYMHHYRAIDPRNAIAFSQPEGRWVHFPEMLPPEVVASHPVYQEFLIPYDRRYNSSCNLVDTPDATVIFSLLSGEEEGPLGAEARAFVERLTPHLQRAARIGIRSFVYSSQALVGHLLVSRLRQPVFLMSPGGDVIHANDAARQLLRSTRVVQVSDGRLQLPQPHLQDMLRRCRELEQSIKAGGAEASAAAAQAGQFHSMRIADRNDSVYAFYTMLSPQREMGVFGLRPVVMLLFYHPDSAPTVDASLLYAMFGLTPAECRIAILLAEGLVLKEIASTLGTQHDTVRKQLRAIFQKTSTKRQPELIRLLLHLPQSSVQGSVGDA